MEIINMIKAIEVNIPGAKAYENFWVTQEVIQRNPQILGEPQILVWEVEGYAEPDMCQVLEWAQSLPLEAPAVPAQVSRAQGKAALIQAGLWGAALGFAQGIPDPDEQAIAMLALNDTQFWRRDSPFLNQAADAIGLSNEQLDALFVAASDIVL